MSPPSFLVGASKRLQLDVNVRHISDVPAQQVPAYTTADARIAWRLIRGLTCHSPVRICCSGKTRKPLASMIEQRGSDAART